MSSCKSPARLLIILFLCTIAFLLAVKIISEHQLAPVRIEIQPEQTNTEACHSVHVPGTNDMEQRCYPLLINFAHGCCRREQKRNCKTGVRFGIQQCLMFNKNSLNNNPGFVQRNKDLLSRKRGAGYWVWKPYFLFQELYLAREGDVIIYSDALVDFVANISHLTKLTKKQDIIIFELTGFKESGWAKRDVFVIMNADKPEYTDTYTKLASYLIIRKSFTSMAFVSEWLTYAQDIRAVTDDENVFGLKNYPDFREHRHDQTIMSILAKKWNITSYPDPSQFGVMHKRPYPTIFDHHRRKSFLGL